jgi:hypothetical protein
MAGCSTSSSEADGTKPIGFISTPFISMAIVRPDVHAADAVDIDGDELVVGVVAKGKPRAYVLKAFRKIIGNVVNDVVDEIPVSVTYCSRTDCVRVFTDVVAGKPLDLRQGGYSDGLLLLSGQYYFQQRTGRSLTPNVDFPYGLLTHEVTTWAKWKQANPETEVYTGDQPIPILPTEPGGPAPATDD